MCGILGMISTGPDPVSDNTWAALRDQLTHRGPDAGGFWRGPMATPPNAPGPHTPPLDQPTAVLAHRRLAVLDPTPAGAQPMATPDRRFVLTYNGELYNEPELRARLQAGGIPLQSNCDTETLLWWLATQGPEGIADLRGMFAFALLDTHEGRLTLARDPLGIKPLYWWRDRVQGFDTLLFASEPRPVLNHPAVTPRPDPIALSAYLTTIRSTLGERTMFEGLHALPAGQVMQCSLDTSSRPEFTVRAWNVGIGQVTVPTDQADRHRLVVDTVTDSTARHLRADVPICCLLSGGLDSAIITSVAGQRHDQVRTYCSGAKDEPPIEGVPQSEDFEFARRMATVLGTNHTEAPIDQTLFLERWLAMVNAQGTVLSTPNEVAINEVARRLRADGCVVALSGEGADELFGGYEPTLVPIAAHVDAGNHAPGRFQLDMAAWVAIEHKPGILTPNAWRDADADAWLVNWAEDTYRTHARDEGLADHLRFQRRTNLVGLLQRVDTAMMLEGVEGRVPFADTVVAALAESLPMADRFAGPGRTKVALREGFKALPEPVRTRPKASFPLPFQRWVGRCAPWIERSEFLRAFIHREILDAVVADPSHWWRLAWPLTNLALWGARWWEQPAEQTRVQTALT